MKIITQTDGGMRGFHGFVGDKTNMSDSFGNPLSIGDVVIVSNQDEFAKQNKWLGNEYGIAFVCEEKTEIANWTGQNHQYIMGIAAIWDSEVFKNNEINYEDDYWDDLYNLMNGWIVHKIKDHNKLAIGEQIDFLFIEDVN
jgi:hypothetical protein